MFALTFLGLFHMAFSFSSDLYVYGTGALLDFDEDDPFFESVSKPEEIGPMELKRLKLRRPKAVHGGFTLNPDAGKGFRTDVPIVENKMFSLNDGGFDDDKQGSISRGLALQNLKKVDASFDTKKPFFGTKKYFLNVIATPYTKRNWEPNFLHTVTK